MFKTFKKLRRLFEIFIRKLQVPKYLFDLSFPDFEFAKSGDLLNIPVPSSFPAVQSDSAQRSGKTGLQSEHAVDRVG